MVWTVKSSVSGVFEDLKFTISEGYEQDWSFPVSVLIRLEAGGSQAKQGRDWKTSIFLGAFWNFSLQITVLWSWNLAIPLNCMCNILKDKRQIKLVIIKIRSTHESIDLILVQNHKCSLLTSDAMKFEPYKMCPNAFNTTFWQFFYFILQISHNKTFKIRYIRCQYIVI